MKYPILLLALFGLSFNQQEEANAIVQQKRGIDVYIYSYPTRPFEVLKTGYFMSSGAGCDIDNGVQRAIDKKAQAVIITLDKNQWQAIVYK
jgi:hypothetical protein